jgi:hypothetical protein
MTMLAEVRRGLMRRIELWSDLIVMLQWRRMASVWCSIGNALRLN